MAVVGDSLSNFRGRMVEKGGFETGNSSACAHINACAVGNSHMLREKKKMSKEGI
jgi:uncharacterized Fe-S cluster protein YjdI